MASNTIAGTGEKQQTLLGADELILNMGPQHPSTHGVLRVKLKLDGERVIGSECLIGYLHRGVEKIAENRRLEEHTSELQSRLHLVCRLLLEKKKQERH